MNDGIRLRPRTADDYAFMRMVYGTTRELERPHFPFSQEQWEAFIDQQFAAQTEHYDKHYPTARFDIIERYGKPIGRLYVDVWESEIRIVDIALAPESRNLGIGAALLREVLDEGQRLGKRVTIHVEGYNPALHLYTRLGFKPLDTNGAYLLMAWTPDQVNTAS